MQGRLWVQRRRDYSHEDTEIATHVTLVSVTGSFGV